MRIRVEASLALLGALSCGDANRSEGLFGEGGPASDGEGDASEGSGAGDGPAGETSGGGPSDGGPSGGDSSSGDGLKLDVGPDSGGATAEGGGQPCDPDTDEGCECSIPAHVPCDAGSMDPFHAMGLDCAGELDIVGEVTGSAAAVGIRNHFGQNTNFDPREGSVYAVIGSGFVNDLDKPTPDGDPNDDPQHCNDDLDPGGNGTDVGPLDPDLVLPPPLDPTAVGAQDCVQDPTLVGMGDCSNTLQNQWDQGASARDYTDLRFTTVVPPDVVSFSYDFAFMTTEWPAYAGSQYNDMYVGWLESEKWTGNISFDEAGSPITLNAAFLEFKDKKNDGIEVPEVDGTCMRYHAATNWLTTTAGVSPGEEITVVFAIFDLSDSILDSYAFLDNFQWGCDPSMTPETEPEG